MRILLVFAVAAALVYTPPAGAELIGYWSFDDKAEETADLSDNGNDGTVNGEAEFVAGHTGQPGDFAIRFDGMDDSVTTDAGLLNDLDTFTMALWVKFEEAQGSRAGFFGQNDVVEFGMINATTMQHWSAVGGALNVAFGPTAESWTHIAVVSSEDERTVYVDGEPVGTAGPSGPGNSDFNLNIGGDGVYDVSGNFFLGSLDDIAVWDDPLSPEQIADLAANRQSPLGEPVVFTDSDGDGLPDAYENLFEFLDPDDPSDAVVDQDGDTLSNLREAERGTDPGKKDTDGDGYGDNVEDDTGIFVDLTKTGTDPLNADTDGDGLRDGIETNTGDFQSAANPGTNPLKVDTDGDGTEDKKEIAGGTDPTNAASKPDFPVVIGLLVLRRSGGRGDG